MNILSLTLDGAKTIFFFAAVAFAFAFPISMFLQNGRAALGKSMLLTVLRRIIAGLYTPFFVIFSIAFVMGAGQQFTDLGGNNGVHGFSSAAAGIAIMFIALAGQRIISPAFSANSKRLLVFSGFIAASVYSAYQMFYLAPFLAAALFVFWGAARRIDKSGILSITNDSHTPHELSYAQFVMTLEYIAPYFLLFTFALVPTGYLSGGIQSMFPLVGNLLNTPQYPIAVFGWLIVQPLLLTAVTSFLLYYKLGSYFLAMLSFFNQANGRQETVRGAAKSADLQSKLDQQ